MALHGPELSTERAPSTERGSMSLRLIRQAVGLFALTNVDGELDRSGKPIRASGCANSTRDQARRPDHGEHKSFTRDGW